MNVLISISHSLCKESFKLRSHKNKTSGTSMECFRNAFHDDSGNLWISRKIRILDEILHFSTELKKQDRRDYEPNSLSSLQASIDIYFSERSYTHSILKSSLLPQKLVWKEKHELFARMEREGYQIKVAA